MPANCSGRVWYAGYAVDPPPQIEFIPAPGYGINMTWDALSEGIKQEIFDSGLLKDEIEKAAQKFGVKGVFAPGSLASQGLSNLTVIGAGGTAATFTGGVGGYPKNSIWTFQSGRWLARIPCSDKLYFPNNIPEATNRRSRPRWVRDVSLTIKRQGIFLELLILNLPQLI